MSDHQWAVMQHVHVNIIRNEDGVFSYQPLPEVNATLLEVDPSGEVKAIGEHKMISNTCTDMILCLACMKQLEDVWGEPCLGE